MDKITLQQPQGLGDILFCQKIAYKLIEYGYTVYWPISTRYSWISDYITKKGLIWGDCPESSQLLNLQYSTPMNHPHDIMTCKYSDIGKKLQDLPIELHSISYEDWSKYLIINRNEQKENELFYNVLNLKDDEEYIFVNKIWSEYKIMGGVEDGIIRKDLKVINKSYIDGFTFFDWSKVIENAVEIHTVDTSINYLVEVLNLKTNILKMYPRHPDHTKKAVGRLSKTKWEWIQ